MTEPERAGRLGSGPEPGIWTGPYVALCAVMFLTYINHTVLLPVIPLYVRDLGGTEFFAGIVLGSFSIASFVLRPRIGRLVDDWDAGRVALVGCLTLALFSLGLWISLLWVVLVASIFRGIAWAGVNTGSNVLLAQLAPPKRRGEASGYYSLFQAAAAIAGPPAALYWLAHDGSYSSVFLVCAVCGLVAAIAARPLQLIASAARSPRVALAPGARTELIARSAILPSALLTLVMFTQPAVLGFVPLYAEELGMSSNAVTAFYVVSGVSALVGRSVLGRVSDHSSRGASLLAGFALMGAALLLLLWATLVPVLLAVGALYSLGLGMALPALTALAIDRADKQRLGMAMATYSAAFQVGQGAGGFVAGLLISTVGYTGLYVGMSGAAAVGMAITIAQWPALGRGSAG